MGELSWLTKIQKMLLLTQKKWQAANKDKVNAAGKRYRDKNKEKCAASTRKLVINVIAPAFILNRVQSGKLKWIEIYPKQLPKLVKH